MRSDSIVSSPLPFPVLNGRIHSTNTGLLEHTDHKTIQQPGLNIKKQIFLTILESSCVKEDVGI